MAEIWKPIPNTDHEISSLGRARRAVDGKVNRSNCKRGHAVASCLDQDGYEWFNIRVNDTKTWFAVHRLVCQLWHGPKPDDRPLALHKDGDNSNNRQSNLYWGSYQDNSNDMVAHGTRCRGGNNPRATLTDDEASEIKLAYKQVLTGGRLRAPRGWPSKMATQYGVGRHVVVTLCCGRSYAV